MKKILFVILCLLSVQTFAGDPPFEEERPVYVLENDAIQDMYDLLVGEEEVRECSYENVSVKWTDWGDTNRNQLFIEGVMQGPYIAFEALRFEDGKKYGGNELMFSRVQGFNAPAAFKAMGNIEKATTGFKPMKKIENVTALNFEPTYVGYGSGFALDSQGLIEVAAAFKEGQFPDVRRLAIKELSFSDNWPIEGFKCDKTSDAMTRGWQSLFTVLPHTKIEKLDFKHRVISSEALKFLWIVLPHTQVEKLGKRSLKNLQIFWRAFPEAQLEVLQSVESFSVDSVFAMFRKVFQQKYIDVLAEGADESELRKFQEAFDQMDIRDFHENLQALVSENRFDAFVKALPKMRFEKLVLTGIDDSVRQQLCAVLEALKGHETMRQLSLHFDGGAFYDDFIRLIPETPLTHLNIEDTGNVEDNKAEIVRFIRALPHMLLTDLCLDLKSSNTKIEAALIRTLPQTQIKKLVFGKCSVESARAIRRTMQGVEGFKLHGPQE